MKKQSWKYTERCDWRPCPGDCDLCGYAEDDVVDEEVEDERSTMAPPG